MTGSLDGEWKGGRWSEGEERQQKGGTQDKKPHPPPCCFLSFLRGSQRHLFRGDNLLLSSASAALGLSGLLGGVLHGVHDLEEGHGLTRSLAGLEQRSGDVGLGASAAALGGVGGGLHRLLVGASGLLAHELALGAGAEGGLLALPVALGLLAHGGAHGVGGSAGSAALGRGAHGLALGAVGRLAQILRAADVALRLVAVDLASSARGLLAMNLALRALAHGVALSRARRVVALPSALGVARGGIHLHLGLHGNDRAKEQEGNHTQQNEGGLHLDT
jgi:hypothetical protein